MPEWRRLYKNVSESKKLSKLKSDSSRLLWTWMIPHTDCEGRVIADPHFLKSRVMSRLNDWTEKKIKKCLLDLDEIRLIRLYEVDGELVAQFEQPNFEEFQKPRRDKETKSRLPEAPPRGRSRPTLDLARPTTDLAGQGPSQNRIEEIRLEESRGEERRGDSGVSPANSGAAPEPPPNMDKKSSIEIWNEFAGKHNLKKIMTISTGSEREKHFKARMKEDLFKLVEILEKAKEQVFLLGQNEKKWIISFDWLIENPGNYIKVLEMKYKDEEIKKESWAERRAKKEKGDPY